MFHIACTRFNNQTYKENIQFRLKSGEKVLYGPAFKIRNTYIVGCLLFVAEMNNQTNKIEGIGLIKNLLVSNEKYKIYENIEYNRYIYRGKYWLSRTDLEMTDPEIVEILDTILFKGKSHLKRMSGISVLTERLFTNWDYDLRNLKDKIKTVFLKHFRKEGVPSKTEGVPSKTEGVPSKTEGVPSKTEDAPISDMEELEY